MQKVFDPDQCREIICAQCPATQFGKTARCMLHQQHIGHITECEAWANHFTDEKGQMYVVQKNPPYELVSALYDAVHSYQWMRERIGILEQELAHYDVSTTAQYGVEGAMPKPKGSTTDKTARSVTRRLRKEETVKRLRTKMELVDKAVAKLMNEQQKLFVDMLMEGHKPVAIAQYIKCSKRQAQILRNEIIEKLAGIVMDDAELLSLYNKVKESDLLN
jgi:hypothetical protein